MRTLLINIDYHSHKMCLSCPPKDPQIRYAESEPLLARTVVGMRMYARWHAPVSRTKVLPFHFPACAASVQVTFSVPLEATQYNGQTRSCMTVCHISLPSFLSAL